MWKPAIGTANKEMLFALSHTDHVKTGGARDRKGMEIEKIKEGEGGRGENAQENPTKDGYANRTKRRDERSRRNATPFPPPPTNGAEWVWNEPMSGLCFAKLDTN